MNLPLPGWSRRLRRLILRVFIPTLAVAFASSLFAQAPQPATPADTQANTSAPSPTATTPAPTSDAPVAYDADITALLLARRYVAGGGNADSRAALLDALGRMGWDVRNHTGVITHPAPAGIATGLALRDYEIDELLWKPAEQPAIRLISFAQTIAIPFEDADPEELAQDLVDVLRKCADSENPQQRFWARFIIALGRVSQTGYDLAGFAPPPVIQPSQAQLKSLEKQAAGNPFALMAAMQPTPVWDEKDPVLAASPLPKRDDNDSRENIQGRDKKRLDEISEQLGALSAKLGAATDPAAQKTLQDKLNKLMSEMGAISNRMTAATTLQMAATMRKMQKAQSGSSDDETDEDEGDDEDSSSDPRFLAEWRDQPLSLLQVSLLTRVIAADLRLYAKHASAPAKSRARVGSFFSPAPSLSSFSANGHTLPFAMITLAQLAPAPAPNFGDQFSGAAGDIWATVTGAYTGAVLDHHLPDSKFSKAAGIANVIIAWYKTIMSVARQNIAIEVENAPLVRTKTRAAGEQRTARAKVEIDFPKSDVLKAIRAAGNLTTIDLQLPDGGPVSGAKVVWRLVEGSYNNKYQTTKGGWEYKPELAVVQFAQGAGYISSTNDAGEATITIEGVPQKKNLPSTVRPHMRRAAIAVEVTIKVGNITQDFNDAINTSMGGPIGGGLSFIADMVLRTSFFFQKSRVFDVKDWKEPLWEGDFEITVKASGSKTDKGEKGGPPVTYKWKMDRVMEGRLNTPEWSEEDSLKKDRTLGRHTLEVDGDSRYFKLDDSSSAKSRNSDNRYEASGPVQIQPPGQNQLAYYGRSEPSGSASLTFTGGKMILELRPFFGAECVVGTHEQNGRRSSSQADTRYLSLLDGVHPDEFSIIEDNDGTQDYYEGSKTFDGLGNLPYVPQFDAVVTVKYRLWRNNPPPKNKAR